MPQLAGALGLDLGEDFRSPPTSDVPTLLLTGTLDGRTYPAEQAAAVAGLSNLTHVTVRNAGHNLFMTSPEVTETIQAFMRGEPIADREIVAPPPSLPQPAE
jgi:pimeloyl-ACP methyl ester carboxylesterase